MTFQPSTLKPIMAHRADAKRMLDDRGYTGHLVRGQPPHLLFEEAVRNRITESYYWKEQCFGLNAATLCDRAAELTFIGGTYNDGLRASAFLCLAFKMLQLNVERDIILEYLHNEDFKYLRALAAFYIRLTSEDSAEVYRMLEPFLEDYRKLRRRNNAGYSLTYLDAFVDDLLTKERVCATSLWKLVPRQQLEDDDKLEERVSPVAHMLDDSEGEADGMNGDDDDAVEETRDHNEIDEPRRSSSREDERRRRRDSYRSDGSRRSSYDGHSQGQRNGHGSGNSRSGSYDDDRRRSRRRSRSSRSERSTS